MRTSWRRIGVRIALMVAVSVSVLAVIGPIWSYRATGVVASEKARASARAVLRAYWWSKVTDGYWEGELLHQADAVRQLPLADRLEFFTAVAVHCDLGNYRAVIFEESVVGEDAPAFSKHLRTLVTSPAFDQLSSDCAEQRQVLGERNGTGRGDVRRGGAFTGGVA